LLYVIAGLAGSVASLLWNPMVNSAGASGAIFGVYGALIAFMLDARNRVPESAMKAQRSAAIVFLLNSLVYGMTHEGIDNAAHLGGLVGGFAMAFLLARPLDPEARATRDVRRLCIVVAGAAAVLMLSALPIKNTFETYRKDSQYRADLEWFDKEQDRLFAAAEQWAQLADSQSLSSGDLADRLERDVVSHWQAIQDRLSKTPLDEGSSLRRHQVLVLEYVASHHDGYRLLAEGTRADDATKLEQADARFKASNAVITKLEQFTLTDDE
jgi:rhomboid protease GluP